MTVGSEIYSDPRDTKSRQVYGLSRAVYSVMRFTELVGLPSSRIWKSYQELYFHSTKKVFLIQIRVKSPNKVVDARQPFKSLIDSINLSRIIYILRGRVLYRFIPMLGHKSYLAKARVINVIRISIRKHRRPVSSLIYELFATDIGKTFQLWLYLYDFGSTQTGRH